MAAHPSKMQDELLVHQHTTTDELFGEIADDDLGIAEEHPRVLFEVQFVFDACKSGILTALDRQDELRAISLDNRHAVDRRRFVIARGRIDDIIGADNENDVSFGEFEIYIIHLNQCRIRDIGLGK